MNTPLRAAIRGATAFGAGYIAAFILTHLVMPDADKETFWKMLWPLAGGAGAIVFFFRELHPARLVMAAAGHAVGFLVALYAAHLLEETIVPSLDPGIAEWAGETCVLSAGFMLGGAIGALSVRPSLVFAGARAFAIGGVMFGLTAISVFYDRAEMFMVILVGLFAAFATGGAFFGYWYQKRKMDDARKEIGPSGEEGK